MLNELYNWGWLPGSSTILSCRKGGWRSQMRCDPVPPLGLMMTKEVLDLNADAPSLEAAIALENRTQVLCGQTEDLREGVNAFLEKRPPVYPGE